MNSLTTNAARGMSAQIDVRFPDDLPTYAADHLAEAKRIAAEWSQS